MKPPFFVLGLAAFLVHVTTAVNCPTEPISAKRLSHLKKCLMRRIANCRVVSVTSKQSQKCQALQRSKFARESGRDCSDTREVKIRRLVQFMSSQSFANTTAARNRFLNAATNATTSIEKEPCKPKNTNHAECIEESNFFFDQVLANSRRKAQNDCRRIVDNEKCSCEDPDCECLTECRHKRFGCPTTFKDNIYTTNCKCERNVKFSVECTMS